MTKQVFSTLAADTAYASWVAGDNGVLYQNHEKTVLIKGGAGVANDRIITPLGVCTEITDEQYDAIKDDETFKLHVRNGFVLVTDKPAPIEVVVPDMEARDNSAPLVPEDYSAEAAAEAKPTTRKGKA